MTRTGESFEPKARTGHGHHLPPSALDGRAAIDDQGPPARRRCAHPECATLLRSTNPDPCCSLHSDYVPPRRAPIRPGSKAESVLTAMPGTARQIAARTGMGYEETRGLISYCVDRDRAIAVAMVCGGCGNRHANYERAE